MDIVKIEEALHQIMREAGRALLAKGDYAVYTKEGHANYATEMDIKTQERLVAALAPLVPGCGFILEEDDTNSRALAPYTFVIDPIDGTLNFMRGLGASCISVALLEDGAPLLGAVYNPWLDELFHARRGCGAYLNGERLQVSALGMKDGVFSVGTAPYDRVLAQKSMGALTALFGQCADIRRFGSAALELCYVAAGRTEGYFELKLSPWDYAAGVLVVEEAGGRAKPLDLPGWDYTASTGIMAANPPCFAALEKVLE